ncbi:transcription factor zf-C2H2 type [Schizosaccharomyces cryophilus OY26]|uniref:Transcription factor zf-C2H2 type n=1 Tax=Schizosaccharomyces cryophilus (strain OY26 / ATCC MYA-4695 / CBS 11777 / NBRC 106824 / NRRL Y48691) TaxID=653667 RepID=S9X2U9_SCHCR|nr:transcription factor zf-C2H2 type [Schizosaccharomyces cryophilus OY26]EPY51407.1 transcription factor zf-C2H2 type [Schizosaccharomyces cryophilus OY26]
MSTETPAVEGTCRASYTASSAPTNPSNVNSMNDQHSASVPPACPYPHVVGPSFVPPTTHSKLDDLPRQPPLNNHKNNLENILPTMPGSSIPLAQGHSDHSLNSGSMADPAIMAAAAASSPHYHPPNPNSPDVPLPPGFLSPYNPFSYAYLVAKANEAAAVAAVHQHQPSKSADQHAQPAQHVDPVAPSSIPPSANPCSAVTPHHPNSSFLTFPFQPPYLPFICPGCAQNSTSQNRLNPQPNSDGFIRCPAPSEHESFVSHAGTEAQEPTNRSSSNEAEPQHSESASSRVVDMNRFGLTPDVHPSSQSGFIPENTSAASQPGYPHSNGFHDVFLSELSAAATLAQNNSNTTAASEGKSQANKDSSSIEKRAHFARRHSNVRKSNQQSNTISSSTIRYRCTECLQGFSRPSSLKIHTYSHTGERPFVCDYVGCGKAFNVRSNMRRHQRIHGA